ncbi:MAG TPA: glycoside hydrolase, partial [Cytophagales bacterium]|nr:glycoside hydrolase [Cytophagales bacterium]
AAGNTALVITAQSESAGGFDFTSARMISEGKLAVRYGLIEVRMKTPDVAGGLWPAFWMMGETEDTWPLRGEIDIMEMGLAAEQREKYGAAAADVNTY